MQIDIPGLGGFEFRHLVLDYNGTLAMDGDLMMGVAAELKSLASAFTIHVVTADTHGGAASRLAGLPVNLVVVPATGQAEAKLEFIQGLGPESVVAIGNGSNDHLMLGAAALGIAVIQREGVSSRALAAADLVSPGILEAFDLLRHPTRIVSTLRT